MNKLQFTMMMKKTNISGAESTVICHDIVALEQALKQGVVHMVYLKKDGSMRDAHGTRAAHLIPEGYRAQGRRKPSPCTLAYWDTERGGWRCLLRNRLLGFVIQNEKCLLLRTKGERK